MDFEGNASYISFKHREKKLSSLHCTEAKNLMQRAMDFSRKIICGEADWDLHIYIHGSLNTWRERERERERERLPVV